MTRPPRRQRASRRGRQDALADIRRPGRGDEHVAGVLRIRRESVGADDGGRGAAARADAMASATQPAEIASRMPPAPSIAWNADQALSHSPSVIASNVPEPAAGSATRWRFAFFDEHVLRIAGDAAGEAVRQAKRAREGENGDAVGPGHPRRECRDAWRGACPPRVAPRRHAPGALRVNADGSRREPAGLLHPTPEEAQCTQLRQSHDEIGVGREHEIKAPPRLLERQARALE